MPERNANLKNAYRDFTEEALALCRQKIAQGAVPSLPPVLPRFTLGRPNAILLSVQGSLAGLDTFDPVQHELQSDANISQYLNTMIGTAYGGMTIDPINLPRMLLSEYLDRVPAATFDAAVFDEVYSNQEAYLYSEVTGFVSMTPLLNLRGDAALIRIREGLEIRQMTDDERNMLNSFVGTDPWILSSTHAIVQTFAVPKAYVQGPESQQPRQQEARFKQLNSVLTALRLFKVGMVGLSYTITSSNTKGLPGGLVGTGPVRQPIYFGRPYDFNQTDAGAFGDFYGEIESSLTPEFDIALRRFNYYYDRPSVEDRFLDAMIAFENLLLPEKDELSLRLALRTSNLLGASVEDKHVIYEFMRKAYKIRSDIAHGSAYDSVVNITEGVSYPIDDFAERLEDYLRKAILAIMRSRRLRSKASIIEVLTNPFSLDDVAQ